MKKIMSFLILGCICGCVKEEAIPVVVDFEFEVFNDDFSVPVQIVFFNRTQGAEDYEWRFEGGSPSRSVNRNPGVIQYESQGTYEIELIGSNQDGSRDSKLIEIRIDEPVVIDFEINNLVDNFSPAVYTFTNTSTGATTYSWTFDEGTPPTSSERDPGEVVFVNPGEHQVMLEVSNGRETYDLQKTVTVAPLLLSDFGYQPAFEDDDYQVPVRIQFENNSISATSFQWSFTGAATSTTNDENPEIIFTDPGIQTITLTSSNGKDSKTTEKTIEVFANTNLRTFTDVRLGINTAHTSNTIGSFFSIADRETYTNNEINNEIGKTIDLVFFGLNEEFTRNRFVSPDRLSETTFEPLQNPKNTVFINSQELCNCIASLSAQEFDALQNDARLRDLTIEETPGGLQSFDNVEAPRVVLFQTQEGKKGAIKIKQFVRDGQNSYIIVDIKVQKESTNL
ncbi:PKD domain-containing protein [Aquimarina gracilis]|uniref:PKD domain-containing protein n=1 Tax=Aquimarina gracilis TaxID=874422 RepID=A0ABU5ZQX1_9FLAO|nr:PKD domain-containing protein [Aquimarina gracilis]MEB3344318.1 PKD domain-containing protein [Aquimarina gracilis]